MLIGVGRSFIVVATIALGFFITTNHKQGLLISIITAFLTLGLSRINDGLVTIGLLCLVIINILLYVLLDIALPWSNIGIIIITTVLIELLFSTSEIAVTGDVFVFVGALLIIILWQYVPVLEPNSPFLSVSYPVAEYPQSKNLATQSNQTSVPIIVRDSVELSKSEASIKAIGSSSLNTKQSSLDIAEDIAEHLDQKCDSCNQIATVPTQSVGTIKFDQYEQCNQCNNQSNHCNSIINSVLFSKVWQTPNNIKPLFPVIHISPDTKPLQPTYNITFNVSKTTHIIYAAMPTTINNAVAPSKLQDTTKNHKPIKTTVVPESKPDIKLKATANNEANAKDTPTSKDKLKPCDIPKQSTTRRLLPYIMMAIMCLIIV
ncbi:hypothetical protein TI05_08715 [Achromatium sp. WMS3]|nr:hypothetical protein TI05_08715 [Achromatium sp. WMS3]